LHTMIRYSVIAINLTQYADTGEYTDNYHAVVLILSVLTPLEVLNAPAYLGFLLTLAVYD